MTILAKPRRTHPERPTRGWLIVARDQPELYKTLQRAYRETDEIIVLRDRRQRERRRASLPRAEERRHRERRSPPAITPDLRSEHYVLVYPAGEGVLAPPAPALRWRPAVLRYLSDRWARLRGTARDQ